MKGLYLPAHAVPFEFFDGLIARAHGQVGDQFPVDPLSPLRCSAFLRVDDREHEFRILLLFADGRKNPDPAVSDFQHSFRLLASFVRHPDVMQPLDAHFSHFIGNRMFSIPRKAIHASAHQEMRAKGFRSAEELVNVALPVAYVNAAFRIVQKGRGLLQILQPADAFFRFLPGHQVWSQIRSKLCSDDDTHRPLRDNARKFADSLSYDENNMGTWGSIAEQREHAFTRLLWEVLTWNRSFPHPTTEQKWSADIFAEVDRRDLEDAEWFRRVLETPSQPVEAKPEPKKPTVVSAETKQADLVEKRGAAVSTEPESKLDPIVRASMDLAARALLVLQTDSWLSRLAEHSAEMRTKILGAVSAELLRTGFVGGDFCARLYNDSRPRAEPVSATAVLKSNHLCAGQFAVTMKKEDEDYSDTNSGFYSDSSGGLTFPLHSQPFHAVYWFR